MVVACVSIWCSGIRFQFRLTCSRGGRDVNRGQDAEDVGLHHAGEQTEQRS